MKTLKPEIIELVAGPRCGDRIRWDDDQPTCQVLHEGKWYIYEYEGNGKALFRPPDDWTRK